MCLGIEGKGQSKIELVNSVFATSSLSLHKSSLEMSQTPSKESPKSTAKNIHKTISWEHTDSPTLTNLEGRDVNSEIVTI